MLDSKPGIAGLRDGRHVGQVRDPLGRGDRERAQLAALDLGQRGRNRRHVSLDLSAHEVGQGLRRALVGDVLELHVRGLLKKFAAEMGDGPVAGRREGDVLRLALGGVDHVAERLEGRVGGNHQDQRGVGHEADRGEVLLRIVRQVGIEGRVDREVARLADDHVVAVGGRLGDEVDADVAAGARLVLDHDRLAECLGELGADHAGQDVGSAPGGERHDQAHRLGRIGRLRSGVERAHEAADGGRTGQGKQRAAAE